MRRWHGGFGVLAAAAICGPVSAAEDLVIHVDAGPAFPAAPPEFPDFWNLGWSAGLGLGIVLTPSWEVVTSAHYFHYGADEENQIDGLLLSGPGGVLAIESIDGRDAESFALLGQVRFHGGPPDATWRPFLAFGAGFFQISTGDATVKPADPAYDPVTIPGDSDGAFAAAIGAGVARRVTPRLSVVFDTTYLIGFTEQSSTESLPLRVGLAID